LVYGSIIVASSLFCISLGLIIQTISINLGTLITLVGLVGLGMGFGITFAPSTLVYISEIVDP